MLGDVARADQRSLRIVVRTTRGALPLLVAAGLAPGACGESENVASTHHPAATTAASGGAAGAAGASGAGGTIQTGFGGSGLGGSGLGGSGMGGSLIGSGGSMTWPDAGGPRHCGSGAFHESIYLVSLPPEGVPAAPGQICSAAVEPVDSNRAARVTFEIDPANRQRASGFVEIDPSLSPLVVGLPTVEVIDASTPELKQVQFSMMAAVAGGFAFQASFPLFPLQPGSTRMTVRTTFEVTCDTPGVTRVVHAAMDVYLCDRDYQTFEWVSAGDWCTVCSIIAEMAPSPIVPDKGADGLPLARALRLRIVELARISNAVVLLAENDGGEGMEYEWHASGGRIEKLAPDVVLWTLEEGMPAPFVQAAVIGPDAAAVASWGFNEAA
jgi:hypothetical protein